MTINEVEARTGLDRGTVRYYESEGLIDPQREANGYRNYTAADVEKLEKVKLLRTLRFSIDDIRAMDADGGDFSDRIRARIKSLDAAKADIADGKRILERMLSENARYETLDAKAYLVAMEEKKELATPDAEKAPDTEAPEAPAEEAPTVSPWRRYFARGFDYGLYYLIITTLVCDVFNASYPKLLTMPHLGVWAAGLMIAAALLFEPLALHLFGTTPGKLIMGIRVTDREGKKLSWSAALLRTLEVLLVGEGLMIPVLSTVLCIRSFVKSRRGERLFWEDESRLEQRGESGVRATVLIAGWILVFALWLLAIFAPVFLPNLGELTPEELSENYNRTVKFFEMKEDWALQPDGSWTYTSPRPASGVETPDTSAIAPPERVEYTLRDGVIVGLRFVRQGGGSGDDSRSVKPAWSQARLLTMSLVGADNGPLGHVSVAEAVSMCKETEFDITLGNWHASFKVHTDGRLLQNDMLIVGNGDAHWTSELVLEKIM